MLSKIALGWGWGGYKVRFVCYKFQHVWYILKNWYPFHEHKFVTKAHDQPASLWDGAIKDPGNSFDPVPFLEHSYLVPFLKEIMNTLHTVLQLSCYTNTTFSSSVSDCTLNVGVVSSVESRSTAYFPERSIVPVT